MNKKQIGEKVILFFLKLDEKKKTSLLDKETIAKNMKTMHLEFIIKKAKEKK